MAILNNSNAITTAGGYNVDNSLRIRISAAAYLSRTFSTTQTDSRKITISFWMKLGSVGSGTNQTIITGYNGSSPGASGLGIQSDIMTWGFGNNSAGNDARLVATQVFKDPSAWYHIVAVGDSTLATSTDRMKLYVNGVQVTAITTYNAPNLNLACQIGVNTANNRIGTRWNTGSEYYDGYLAEFYVIDGQALTPSSFGAADSSTGVWKPKAYTGTYGNNGYYLDFSDIATTSGSNAGLGKDFSGNGNFWNTTNISVTAGSTYDAMVDSPTNTSETVGNYANFNGSNLGTYANATITEAGLRVSVSAGGTPDGGKAYAPFGMYDGSGKWYFEMTCVDPGASNQRLCFGIANVTTNPNAVAITNGYYASASGAHGNYNIGTFTTNDILQVAYDSTTNKLWFGKNNTWYNSGNPVTGANPTATVTSGVTYVPFSTYASSGGGPGIGAWNFGQRPLSYTPPTGYNRLNTFNLPNSAVLQGNKVMDSTLYTGTGANATITNAGGFKPDLVWVKVRSTTGTHVWTDSNRGANKQLFSNLTDAEASSTIKITGFTSTGFTLGADNGTGTGDANFNGSTYVGWQWQAGQGSTSSNTSGSITSTVSVSTTAGFSIVTYTGSGSAATVGHGLGVTPSMVIVKNRTTAGHSWAVRHVSLTSTQNLALQNTDAAYTVSSATSNGGIGTLTSTTFSFISGTVGYLNVNASANNYVAYCWAPIPGYSAFGSYVANASADGPFIYTGFRPEWIMFKRTTSATNWYVIDTSISPYNSSTTGLYPNTNAAVSTEGAVNILSNGFKCAQSSGAFNFPSGETFIYAAFAENPFKNANAR